MKGIYRADVEGYGAIPAAHYCFVLKHINAVTRQEPSKEYPYGITQVVYGDKTYQFGGLGNERIYNELTSCLENLYEEDITSYFKSLYEEGKIWQGE